MSVGDTEVSFSLLEVDDTLSTEDAFIPSSPFVRRICLIHECWWLFRRIRQLLTLAKIVGGFTSATLGLDVSHLGLVRIDGLAFAVQPDRRVRLVGGNHLGRTIF